LLAGARARAFDLFLHRAIETVDRAAVAIGHGGDLVALRQRHAHAFDRDIDDGVVVVAALAHDPLDLGRWGTIRTDELADDNGGRRAFAAGAGHLDLLAAILAEARRIGAHDPVLEKLAELLALIFGRGVPIAAEHETRDTRDIEAAL